MNEEKVPEKKSGVSDSIPGDRIITCGENQIPKNAEGIRGVNPVKKVEGTKGFNPVPEQGVTRPTNIPANIPPKKTENKK